MVVSLLMTFWHRASPISAFVTKKNLALIHTQQLDVTHVYGSSARRKSLLNNDNTRADMEDNVLLLPLLEAELVKLKGSKSSLDEGAQRIQELTDEIDNAKTAAEFGVRRVQAEFYEAFSSADFEKMTGVWSTSDDVSCVHPGMQSLQGLNVVMESWKQIFAGYAGSEDEEVFQIAPSRVKIDICGGTAICSCVEETNGGRIEALNIYRREGGSWKMINHHASPTIM